MWLSGLRLAREVVALRRLRRHSSCGGDGRSSNDRRLLLRWSAIGAREPRRDVQLERHASADNGELIFAGNSRRTRGVGGLGVAEQEEDTPHRQRHVAERPRAESQWHVVDGAVGQGDQDRRQGEDDHGSGRRACLHNSRGAREAWPHPLELQLRPGTADRGMDANRRARDGSTDSDGRRDGHRDEARHARSGYAGVEAHWADRGTLPPCPRGPRGVGRCRRGDDDMHPEVHLA
mmetsp:Transcript_127112/g.367992  ORF Transcript_127112/g.367992 Transcript_127112/m.367992 type:complete len:234 (-) Transcript_127112:557-1258(-)